MAPQKGTLLSTTDFPLYAVRSLGDRHFLVAGGGGQAKTGVPNAVEIYELKLSDNKILSASLCRHDTGIQAVMNCDTFYDGRNHYLATGQDDECHTYSLKYKVVSPEKQSESKDAKVRKRKGESENSSKEKCNNTKHITFDIEPIKHVTTDFAKDGSFQKVVRFGADNSILATGGADGFVRVWQYPDMKKIYEVKAHNSDIDDLDVSPCGQNIVTVSRDNTGSVWKAKEGKKVSDLVFKKRPSEQYRFRCCRYGNIEGKKGKFNLYTLSIPSKRSSKPSPCYMTLWDPSTFKPKKHASTGTEVLSSLAVSDDGIYLGVGTISGSVSVYVSFSLQRLYHVKEAHSIFVTGVEFMPSSEGARAVTGGQDFTLLSISADNTIKIHQVAPRGSYSAAWLIAGTLAIIYVIFWLMSSFGI
ncbi:prolactin regulatory element-binding protein-like [Haliotis rufescens]|uniref:prolactin regulatory element-binding protein-like n=1 Tax=Haliotis rufescens TaxID=6454 RepID=UPI00201F1859|nr:prolactin regulatory element-binding protein-like [Haliotis rufescens]